MDQTVEEEAALVCQENKHALPGLKSCAPAFNKFYSCSHFCFETKLVNNFVFQLFHFCTLTYYVGLSHQLFVSWIFPKIYHLETCKQLSALWGMQSWRSQGFQDSSQVAASSGIDICQFVWLCPWPRYIRRVPPVEVAIATKACGIHICQIFFVSLFI